MSNGAFLDGIFEEQPHSLPGGRIVHAAHFQPGLRINPIYTDDPTGVSGWVKAQFTSAGNATDMTREIEPDWFARSDGALRANTRTRSPSTVSSASSNGPPGPRRSASIAARRASRSSRSCTLSPTVREV